MADLSEKMTLYAESLRSIGESFDEFDLKRIAENMSLSEQDRSVSSGELESIYSNYVAKKFGVDIDTGMNAIKEVDRMLSNQSIKYRPVFYYLLSKKLG